MSLDGRRLARQLAGIVRLDLRRALLSRRSLAVYALALGPVALVAAWAASPLPERIASGPQEAVQLFAVVFELYLRVSVFFSCLFLFVSLYRSEILERSLHYYLLTPARREVVALGKYLAALVASVTVFAAGTVALFLLIASAWGAPAMGNYLFNGPGLANLSAYLGVLALGCAGYGALFLLVGVWFRNPVIPAAAIWAWEAANLLLPPMLKRVSVIFYLQSLYPVPLVPKLFEVAADPAPAWLATLGAILFIGAVLVLVTWRVRRMDLAYGGE